MEEKMTSEECPTERSRIPFQISSTYVVLHAYPLCAHDLSDYITDPI